MRKLERPILYFLLGVMLTVIAVFALNSCKANTTNVGPTPTVVSTAVLTPVPTAIPTPVPTAIPTPVPTAIPTPVPTAVPTPVPTAIPTPVPTAIPTPVATAVPTPVATAVPTPVPTAVPTPVPTAVPTPVPTAVLTPVPTAVPTPVPTAVPTPVPTAVPTPVPTAVPTPVPTAVPTPVPTEVPTPVPTPLPTPTPTPNPGPANLENINRQLSRISVSNEILPSIGGNKGWDFYYVIDLNGVDQNDLYNSLKNLFVNCIAHSVDIKFAYDGSAETRLLTSLHSAVCPNCGKLLMTYNKANTMEMSNLMNQISDVRYANQIMLDFLQEHTVGNPFNSNERLTVVCAGH